MPSILVPWTTQPQAPVGLRQVWRDRGLVFADTLASRRVGTVVGTRIVQRGGQRLRGFGSGVGVGSTDSLVPTRLQELPPVMTMLMRTSRRGAGGGGLGRLLNKTLSTLIYANGTASLSVEARWSNSTNYVWGFNTGSVPTDIGVLCIRWDLSSSAAVNATPPVVRWSGAALSRTATPTVSTGATWLQSSGNALYIGNNENSNRNWDGVIGDLAVFASWLTDAECAALERNLYSVYAPRRIGVRIGVAAADATAPGALLTATASSVPGQATAASSAAGATLAATTSVLAGAASASSAAPGATIAATADLLPGAAMAGSTAGGTTLAAEATLLAGGATGGAAGIAPGATLLAAVSAIAGDAVASSIAAGATVTASATLVPGDASGGASAVAPGALLLAQASLVPGGVQAGSAAPGTLLPVVASLIAGAAAGGAAGVAPGALLLAQASLLAGGVAADAQAQGALLAAVASVLPGNAEDGTYAWTALAQRVELQPRHRAWSFAPQRRNWTFRPER